MRLTRIATTWIVVAALESWVCAQTNEPVNTQIRRLTLDECVNLALTHNLALKIQSYEPQIFRYALSGAYGAYDPLLDAQAQRRVSTSQGGIDPNTGEQFAGSERESDEFTTGLTGLLPTGLTYDLFGNINQRQGDTSDIVIAPSGATNIVRGTFSFYDGSAGVAQLSQPLLRNSWIDATRFDIKIRKSDLKISELVYAFNVMSTVNNVERRYYELIFAMENAIVAEKALELAERALYEANKKVAIGVLPELDEKQAQAEVETAKSNLIDARYIVTLRENELKNLITDDYAQVHKVRVVPAEKLEALPQVYDLGESWFRALAQRPDYQEQMLRLQQAEVTEKFRFNQLFPRLDAFGSYSHAGLGLWPGDVLDDLRRGTSPNYTYGLRFSMPLSRRAERNAYRSAQAVREQTSLTVKQFEQTVLVSIVDSINFAKSRFEAVSATRQARFYAEAALDAEQKKFENGKSTTFLVLQFQSLLTERRAAEIRALADYNQALSDLNFRQGTNLQRHRINLRFQ